MNRLQTYSWLPLVLLILVPALAQAQAPTPPQSIPANATLGVPEALPAPREQGQFTSKSAVTLTLDQLENLAQTYNPILRRDMAQIDSARGKALQAGLYPNPRWDTNNPWVFAGRNSQLNAGVMQEIVVKGKLRLDRAAANQSTRQATLLFHQNRLTLLTAVRRQFFTVLATQRRVQILIELLGITRKALETSRKLQKAGVASEIDTLLLNNDFQQIQARLHQAQALLGGQRKQLAAVVGVADVQNAKIVGDLSAARPNFDEEVVRHYAVNASTLIQFANSEITRNEILLQRAEVEPYPNVTVGPAYAFATVPHTGNNQFWFTFNFPIPVWNRNQGNILAAKAEVAAARQNLRAIQNDQLQEVADALAHYQGARQVVERYEQQILPNLRKTLRLAQEGYAKGVFDFSRYLQAQRTIVEANLNYIDALEGVWTSAARVAGLLQLEQLHGTRNPIAPGN